LEKIIFKQGNILMAILLHLKKLISFLKKLYLIVIKRILIFKLFKKVA